MATSPHATAWYSSTGFKRLIVALTIASVGWYVYGLLFPRTLADDARDIAHVVWGSNGRSIYPYLFDSEIKALNLDRKKADEVMNKLVLPRMTLLKNVQIGNCHVNNNRVAPSQGVCEISYTYPSGMIVPRASETADASDGGGKTSLCGLLIRSWFVLYHAQNPDKPFTAATGVEAYLSGIQKDREVLEKLGISGCFNPADPTVPVPWDVYMQRMSDRLKEFTDTPPADTGGTAIPRRQTK